MCILCAKKLLPGTGFDCPALELAYGMWQLHEHDLQTFICTTQMEYHFVLVRRSSHLPCRGYVCPCGCGFCLCLRMHFCLSLAWTFLFPALHTKLPMNHRIGWPMGCGVATRHGFYSTNKMQHPFLQKITYLCADLSPITPKESFSCVVLPGEIATENRLWMVIAVGKMWDSITTSIRLKQCKN